MGKMKNENLTYKLTLDTVVIFSSIKNVEILTRVNLIEIHFEHYGYCYLIFEKFSFKFIICF